MNQFNGMALYTAKEIKPVIQSYESELKRCCLLMDVPLNSFIELGIGYSLAASNLHELTKFPGNTIHLFSDESECYKFDDFCFKMHRWSTHAFDIKNLSNNGKKDCYLTPDQSMFINEWKPE